MQNDELVPPSTIKKATDEYHEARKKVEVLQAKLNKVDKNDIFDRDEIKKELEQAVRIEQGKQAEYERLINLIEQ